MLYKICNNYKLLKDCKNVLAISFYEIGDHIYLTSKFSLLKYGLHQGRFPESFLNVPVQLFLRKKYIADLFCLLVLHYPTL